MTKREFADVKRRRRFVKASLEFSQSFDTLRRRYRLSNWDTVKLLQEQTFLYMNVTIKKR